jgi:hypothetical protein
MILGAFVDLQKSTIRFVMYVRPSALNNLAFTGRIFMQVHISAFF